MLLSQESLCVDGRPRRLDCLFVGLRPVHRAIDSGNVDSLATVLIDLITQRARGDFEHIGRFRAAAAGPLERIQDMDFLEFVESHETVFRAIACGMHRASRVRLVVVYLGKPRSNGTISRELSDRTTRYIRRRRRQQP